MIYEFDLTYSFKTDIHEDSGGGEFRNATLYKPVRKAEYKLKEFNDMFGFMNDLFYSGQYPVKAPLWCFTDFLNTDISSGGTNAIIADSNFINEFTVGEYVLIRDRDDSSINDVTQITSINVGANTIIFTPGVSRNWYTWNTFVVPAIDSLAEIKDFTQVSRHSAGEAAVEIFERVNTTIGTTSLTTPNLLLRPAEETQIEGSIISHREVEYQDSGVPEYCNYLDPAEQRALALRKMTFGVYNYSDWVSLRTAFLNCRGQEGVLRVPTWGGELKAYAQALPGASQFNITPPSFTDVRTIYDKLLVEYNGGLSTQLTTVTSVVNNTTYATVYISGTLDSTIVANAPIHLVPLVRFASDDLTFQFKAKNLCIVETSFMEVKR
jgi:hypothetical protein